MKDWSSSFCALSPIESRKTNGSWIEIRYISRKSDCGACALRSHCLSAKTPRRTITAGITKRSSTGIVRG
jgi:hypothetical protein